MFTKKKIIWRVNQPVPLTVTCEVGQGTGVIKGPIKCAPKPKGGHIFTLRQRGLAVKTLVFEGTPTTCRLE